MFGPPNNVEGKCNVRLRVADDYGDNHCTFMCQLEPGHSGLHKESFIRAWLVGEQRVESEVVITWQEDERLFCPVADEE